MQRSPYVLAGLLAVALVAAVAAAPQEVTESPDPMVIEVPGASLGKHQVPLAELVSSWVRFMGRAWSELGESAVRDLLAQYGLDPDTPATRHLLEIDARYWDRFPASALGERYRNSKQPEEVVMRQWAMERARFFGREIGAWFVALEAEGVDVDALVETIRASPYYDHGIDFIDEGPDFERMEQEAVAFHAEFRKAFGGPLRSKEVE